MKVELSDILNYKYSKLLEIKDRLSTDEILIAYLRTKPNKILGLDKILNKVVHLLARSRIALLERLF